MALRSQFHRDAIRDGHHERLKFELYANARRRMELLFELVSKPLKFPARRRRQDREVPKAA